MADAEHRHHAERIAAMCFAVGAIAEAIVCAAVIVSGWFAGVIRDEYERMFWAGAVLSFVMVVVFAIAVFPGGTDDARVTRRVIGFTRIGLVLLVLVPTLCIGALVADFYL